MSQLIDGSEPAVEYLGLVRFGDTERSVNLLIYGETKTYDIDGLTGLKKQFLDAQIIKEIDHAIRDLEYVLENKNISIPEMSAEPHMNVMQ